MNKKYLVFAGHNYYPSGGWDDFISSHSSLDEAIDAAKKEKEMEAYDWWHVVDFETGSIVEKGRA